MKHSRFFTKGAVCFVAAICFASFMQAALAEKGAESSARGVLERLIGERANEFVLKEMPKEDGVDVFEVEASDGKVTVSGSSGVAISRGAYEYLRKACGCHVSWEGNRLPLPERFPDYPRTRVVCWNKYRHYFNVCTFGYTLVWWDWARWEREIDWMALHGINLPLAMNAQEAVWQKVWKEYGFTDEDLKEFFAGPAFLPWYRMGNIIGHGGGLPQGWLDAQSELQKKILKRERELGMTPIVPAFSGFIPPAFARRFPEAKVMKTTGWYGFGPTFILNPTDPMFQTIGKRFIEEYRKEFGSDHFYLADTFNEMRPDVKDEEKLEQLAAFGESVLQSILAGDPDGTWLMMGWVFLDGSFWREKEINALFSKVPTERMIILDLAGFGGNMWSRYNRQYIHCLMSNYGHITTLYGNMPHFAGLAGHFESDACRQMVGYGLVPEGIENNTAFYELLTDAMWDEKPLDYKKWVKEYCMSRYGGYPPKMGKAWDAITDTIYRNSGFPTPVYLRRPTFGDRSAYPEPKKMRETVELFLECSDEFGANDLYTRDLVDLMKHYLGDATFFSLQRVVNAWQNGDRAEFKTCRRDYLELLDDLDRLVGTRPEYRLSKWINDARRWGTDSTEADFYEKNARLQLTVWGSTVLFDYARKEWSGLISNFYAPRFERYFDVLAKTDPDAFSQDEWSKSIAQWELDWCSKTGLPKARASGDGLDVAKELFRRYRDWPEEWGPYSPAMGIAVGKPVTISGGTVHNHQPERAVDGDSWNTDSAWHAAPVPQWIRIDLEKPAKIDRVQVFNRWAHEVYQYTVEVSADGETWTTVADMSKNERRATSLGFLHTFKAVTARYVRVTILHNSANPGIHLVEVRVFESK